MQLNIGFVFLVMDMFCAERLDIHNKIYEVSYVERFSASTLHRQPVRAFQMLKRGEELGKSAP